MPQNPDIEADLRRIEPLVGIMAAERTKNNPNLYDDARQEGLIRVWQERVKNPQAPRSHLTVAARGGVLDVVRGRRLFGAPSHRGRREPMETALFVAGRDDGQAGAVTFYDTADEPSRRAFEAVTAYPEVREAVRQLPEVDRVAVVLQYARGLTMAEAARVIGQHPDSVRKRMRTRVIPRLRQALEPHRE